MVYYFNRSERSFVRTGNGVVRLTSIEGDGIEEAKIYADANEFAIGDATFCKYIDRLKDLHNFLYQEAVPVNPSDAISLEMGNLSALFFHAKGRPPTPLEWNQVERQTQAIFLLLTPSLRRKFLMGGTPWIVAWMPIYFLGIAAVSLVAAVAIIRFAINPFWILPVYLLWLATLGATGALAFIGMNALSIQDDITFDLTNTRLMLLRVALGALFAVVLTLPFGYEEFLSFCNGIAVPFSTVKTSALTKQAIFLLQPFVLGFSTSVVILILNQMVDAVQTFFGRRSSQESFAASPPPRMATYTGEISRVQQANVAKPSASPQASKLPGIPPGADGKN